MSATLGGLIKDYRLQKNISQLDIAFALGWKEPSRLSRIEQGRIEKPKRELIESLIQAMKLRDEERNTLLMVGGYLPTTKEMDRTILLLQESLQLWHYPATLVDFSWRIIYSNEKIFRLYRITQEEAQYIQKERPNVLELHFNILLPKLQRQHGKNLNEMKDYLKDLVFRFRNLQKGKTRERWYIELIQKLMENDLFRELWQQTEHMDETLLNGGYIMKVLPSINDDKQLLKHHYFATPLSFDPRFIMGLYVPADTETFNYYDKEYQSEKTK